MLRWLGLLLIVVLTLSCGLAGGDPTPGAPTGAPLPQAAPSVTPEADPTPTSAAPTAIPGWLTYHNAMVGYSFEYPPEASLTSVGVTGYPTEELPPGLEPGQYFATLEATYSEALCAGIELPAAVLTFQAPDDEGGRYAAPCGRSGVGVYDLRSEDLSLTIEGTAYPVSLTRLYEVGTETLVGEFGGVMLGDGTRIAFDGTWTLHGLTYEDYLADRGKVFQVIESYRTDP